MRKGYHFDVEPSAQASDEGADENTDAKQIAEQITALRKTMQQLSIQGDDLLELPADISDQDNGEDNGSFGLA